MDLILDEVRRDVFEHPKPTIDLDYLYSVKNEIQKFADDTNSQLKKNVYQNYSLFIESSREIATLKEEMRQLNVLLEQQQASMNKMLDQLNKAPIIQPTIERSEPRADIFTNLNNMDSTEAEQAEMLPEWFIKSPEDFDVLIAQRNLKEAVELSKRVKAHLEQYPKCCENNHSDLKEKIDVRMQELVSVICSELQPATDRSVKGGPRSSIGSIQLLRELNLSSKAVRLYLDLRSSVLHFILEQQNSEPSTTVQFIKQICSIFIHNVTETCNEFKQAFEVDYKINKAVDECDYLFDYNEKSNQNMNQLLFDLVRPVYQSEHPKFDKKPTYSNGNDFSSQILNPHNVRVPEEVLVPSRSSRNYKTFYYLSTYASLTYWITLEFENFAALFRKHVFENSQLTLSMIAESIYFLRTNCSRMSVYSEMDMSHFIDQELEIETRKLIEDSGRKLLETIKTLDKEEKWQDQHFQNKADKTRFLEEMNDVGLTTMPKYISENFTLNFTASKTAFARCFLITTGDLAKLVRPNNKNHIDTVLAKAFELQMESVVNALSKAKTSQARRIMGNSNFLLDKVIPVAEEKFTSITNLKCQKLADLRTKYKEKANNLFS